VIFHAFPALMPGGFVGVDIFFVISGFLISGIIFKGLQRDTFTFSGFYANRIKRIFPALLLVLACCFAFGWFFLFPGEFAQLGKHIFGGAGYVENFVLRREAGYFDTSSFRKPLMHLWSLGIEEQFYLTYPFLLWLTWRLRRNFLAVIVPLVLMSFVLNLFKTRSDSVASFFLPQTRFWELWAGGLLAYVGIFNQNGRISVTADLAGIAPHPAELDPSPRAVTAKNIFSVLGIVLITFAIFRVDEKAYPGWHALIPVCGASLLILGGPSAWINRRILSNRFAVFVGLISYPLYLWHWPILSFPRIISGRELTFTASAIAVTVSGVLSWATWRFVENPIRFGRRTWTKTASLVLLSVIIAFVGYTTFRQDGFAQRFKNLPDELGKAQPEQWSTAECRKRVGTDEMEFCRGGARSPADVLLIGDSHAATLYRALARAYEQRSQTLMNIGAPGCVPFYDTESYTVELQRGNDCKLTMNRALNFAALSPSVRTIILSLRGPLNMTGQRFGEEETEAHKQILWDGAPKDTGQAEMFAASLRNTVSRLISTGKTVILFIDWPELGFDPKSCLRAVSFFSRPPSLCGVPRPQVEARNRAYRNLIFELKKELVGVRIFDPFPYLCDSTACYAMSDGHLLYRDDNHLSAAGAAYLSAKFLAEQSSKSP
jgi:peptidoglycan/LPS O-acetylase OafA/YrhL